MWFEWGRTNSPALETIKSENSMGIATWMVQNRPMRLNHRTRNIRKLPFVLEWLREEVNLVNLLPLTDSENNVNMEKGRSQKRRETDPWLRDLGTCIQPCLKPAMKAWFFFFHLNFCFAKTGLSWFLLCATKRHPTRATLSSHTRMWKLALRASCWPDQWHTRAHWKKSPFPLGTWSPD